MYYVEIDGNRVRYVGGGNDYKILPPNSVEIESIEGIHEGMIYEPPVLDTKGEIVKPAYFREQTAAEVNAQYRPTFNAQRNALFAETMWVRERHSDMKELAIDDKTNWTAWLNYWQALRNMPQQTDFDASNPKFPEKPK